MLTLGLAPSQTQIWKMLHGLSASLKKTQFQFTEAAMVDLPGFYITAAEAKWLCSPCRHRLSLKCDPASLPRLAEKDWMLSGRWIREQCQICFCLISPIYHCLLSATEPAGSSVSSTHQTAATGGQELFLSICQNVIYQEFKLNWLNVWGVIKPYILKPGQVYIIYI